jgi:hypothetical protein
MEHWKSSLSGQKKRCGMLRNFIQAFLMPLSILVVNRILPSDIKQCREKITVSCWGNYRKEGSHPGGLKN